MTEPDEPFYFVPPRPLPWWRRWWSHPRRPLWDLFKPMLITLAVIAACIVFAIIKDNTSSAPAAPVTSPLVDVRNTCDPTGQGMTVADGDKTLIIDSRGAEDTIGVDTVDLACALRELGTPAAVIQHMDSTRAIDGRQTDEWPGVKAAWTYHPDAGLDLVIQTN